MGAPGYPLGGPRNTDCGCRTCREQRAEDATTRWVVLGVIAGLGVLVLCLVVAS